MGRELLIQRPARSRSVTDYSGTRLAQNASQGPVSVKGRSYESHSRSLTILCNLSLLKKCDERNGYENESFMVMQYYDTGHCGRVGLGV